MSKPSPAINPNVMDLIAQYNLGRDPERLAMKYQKMSASPFIFLRGAAHLFYQFLPDTPLFRDAPLAWCCGDLHFENYGSYKADNRLVYFDINDYDEAALAPCTWDIVRLLTSIQCGADALKTTKDEAILVSQSCLHAYRNALINGKPLWVEQETATGLVKDLFTALQNQKRTDFLDKRTTIKGHQRSLKIDGIKACPATEEQKKTISAFMLEYAATQANPKFYEVLDIACRIAGTGSLGLQRFVVLIEGKGSPDGNYLLDIKEAKASALSPRLHNMPIPQPTWQDDATRIVAIQTLMQAVNHAFLQPVIINHQPYILRGLQPTEDRVAIGDWGKKIDRLKEVATTMGNILAWDQLRASGRNGAANADALIDFAKQEDWAPELMHAASDMTTLTQSQWKILSDHS